MADRYSTLVDQKFNRLKFIEKTSSASGNMRGMFSCDCGTIAEFTICNVKSGHTKSCGCLNLESITEVRHGHSKRGHVTKTYSTYRDMITRCENKQYKEFYLYGGRGITVCERWRNSFEDFLADMGEKPTLMTLERVDVDAGYSPNNCIWASKSIQANNKRTSVIIEFNNKAQTVAQWSRELGIPDKKIYRRISNGWPADRALKI